MIGGLLEGAAFLAARVQLKLKHEFSDFTTNLHRSARAALSRADAVLPARPGAAEIWRSRLARGPRHRARRLFRRGLSRTRAQHRLPLPTDGADRALAVRDYSGRIFHQRGPAAGARAAARRRMRGRPALAAERARRAAHRGRARRQGGRGAAGAAVLGMPRQGACASPARARNPMRSRFTSRCSPIAGASISAFSTPSAIPSSSGAATKCCARSVSTRTRR